MTSNLRPPWKPGQSGNPSGRPRAAGLTVREWVNELCNLTERDLRAIVVDPKSPASKRTAATRMLRSLEHPDMADFTDFLNGAKTIEELRAAGVDTSVVKKARVKVEFDAVGGRTETREIELIDRSLSEFTELVNQTAGKPRESIEIASSRVGEESQEAFDILWQRYGKSPESLNTRLDS